MMSSASVTRKIVVDDLAHRNERRVVIVIERQVMTKASFVDVDKL